MQRRLKDAILAQTAETTKGRIWGAWGTAVIAVLTIVVIVLTVVLIKHGLRLPDVRGGGSRADQPASSGVTLGRRPRLRSGLGLRGASRAGQRIASSSASLVPCSGGPDALRPHQARSVFRSRRFARQQLPGQRRQHAVPGPPQPTCGHRSRSRSRAEQNQSSGTTRAVHSCLQQRASDFCFCDFKGPYMQESLHDE